MNASTLTARDVDFSHRFNNAKDALAAIDASEFYETISDMTERAIGILELLSIQADDAKTDVILRKPVADAAKAVILELLDIRCLTESFHDHTAINGKEQGGSHVKPTNC